MQVTTFGYLLLAVFIIGEFLPIKYFIGILICACVFQSSVVLNVGGKGIAVYVIASIFFL